MGLDPISRNAIGVVIAVYLWAERYKYLTRPKTLGRPLDGDPLDRELQAATVR